MKIMSTKLKLLGVDVASIGDAQMKTPESQEVVLQDNAAGVYKKLVINAKGDRLLGAILVGNNQDYSNFLTCYLDNTPLPTHAAALLLDASLLSTTSTDQSLVCSCHHVTRGDLINEIKNGCQTLAELKTSTKSGQTKKENSWITETAHTPEISASSSWNGTVSCGSTRSRWMENL